MKKKNRDNGLKIGGAVIALVLIIHWGNVFFKAKDTFTPQPKQQTKSNPKKQSKSTPTSVTLSCVFQDAYEDGRRLNPGSEVYALLSADFSIYLHYPSKQMEPLSWKTTIWNENKIMAEYNRDLTKGFYVNNTFTLNRNTGKLSRVIINNYGSTYINYKCSKGSKKF